MIISQLSVSWCRLKIVSTIKESIRQSTILQLITRYLKRRLCLGASLVMLHLHKTNRDTLSPVTGVTVEVCRKGKWVKFLGGGGGAVPSRRTS